MLQPGIQETFLYHKEGRKQNESAGYKKTEDHPQKLNCSLNRSYPREAKTEWQYSCCKGSFC